MQTQSTENDTPAAGFAALGVAPHIVEALDGLGITAPFPIQASTIPVALGGADIIGQAKTGTGKTLAFGVPVLQRIEPDTDGARPAAPATTAAQASAAARPGGGRRRGRAAGGGNPGAKLPPAGGTPQALIVVPTRELAVQVCADLTGAGATRAVRVQALYGGRAYEPQVKALAEGIDVAVATPGRLLDLANQGHLVLDRVRTLVLDEADEMLDLGFLPDVERIIRLLPARRQTMLFSATMPGAVISLARQYMNRPTHIRAADPHDEGVSVANIKQFVYRAHDLDKIEMLARILQARGRGLTMVFARTKRAVARITEELQDRHFAVGAVHGDLAQGAREQALRAFRNGKVDVLVATDVAARGIDVEGVTHVVNYQCPEDEKVYTHRIGRTGRAGRTGISVTLVDWEDMPRWGLINKALGLDFAEPAELYSTSAQLYTDLDIPEGAKGALPKQDRVRAGLAAEELEDLGEPGRQGRGRGRDAAEPEPRRERTPRQRRRTRGGVRAGEAVAASDAGVTGAGATLEAEERAAVRGAAPVTELFREPAVTQQAGLAHTAEPSVVVEAREVDIADGAGRPKRARTRRRAGTPVAVEATAAAEPSVTSAPEDLPAAADFPEPPAASPVEEQAVAEPKAPRRRTRTRVAAETKPEATQAPQPAPAAPAAQSSDEPLPADTQAADTQAEPMKPARRRASRKAVEPAVAPEPATIEAPAPATAPGQAEPAAEPAVAKSAAKRTAAKKTAKTATKKTAAKRTAATATAQETTAQETAAPDQPAAQPEAAAEAPVAKKTAARKSTAKKTTTKKAAAGNGGDSATGRGGSIRLAPGSLADPVVPAPEPVRPAPVNEPVELAEAVFTQEPILPTAQRAARKRTGKRSVAAQGPASAPVTSVLPPEGQPVAAAPVAGDDPAQGAALDTMNVGPVANRRRTRI